MTTYEELRTIIERLASTAKRRDAVLRKLIADCSDKEIAEGMTLAHGTVRKHISNLYENFGIDTGYTSDIQPRQQLIDLFTRYAPQLLQDGKTDYVPYNQLSPPEPPPFPLVGCLTLDSPYYVVRSIDERIRQLFSSHQDPSSLCLRITGSKGMGKSSLLARIRQYLEKDLGHFVAKINLSGKEFNHGLESFDTLLYRFTYLVARAFLPALDKEELPNLKDKWDENMIPGMNATDYLNDYVFEKVEVPKTLIIDGIDAILDHESNYAQFSEFLRSWFENKMKQVTTAKIVWPHIIMAYSTEPYANFANPIGSPLQNVGIPLELPELTESQVKLQAHQYGLQWQDAMAREVMDWVGGHPELINRTLYYFTSAAKPGGQSINSFFDNVINERNREFDDYLFKNLNLLRDKKNKKLKAFFLKTLQGEEWRDEFVRFQLEKAGLVKIEGDQLCVRFKLYQEYFKKHLAVDHED